MYLEVKKEHLDYLKSKDDKLAVLIDKYGMLEVKLNENTFNEIIFCIIGQMLSAKAAKTIIERFVNLLKEVTPENIVNASYEDIRKCGISYTKITFLKDLSSKIISGEINLSTLKDLRDDELIDELMKIKGIGKWTAEMVAIFSLGRLNIFSYDDISLRNAIMKVHNLETLSKNDFEEFRSKYSPYCSIASLYYYHYTDNE